MARKFQKRLVVDASVMRSSGGEDATYPTSKNCRDFLNKVLEICHRIVLTPDIDAEWKRHQSGFAQKWRVKMERKGKIPPIDIPVRNELRVQIEKAADTPKNRDAMLKDTHLIEAALSTDLVVVSLDDRAKDLFANASSSVRELKRIIWVNPDQPGEESPISWLEAGAKPEKNRSLQVLASRD